LASLDIQPINSTIIYGLMLYNVSQLLKEPIGSTREYRVDEIVDGPELLAGKVLGQVNLLHTHQGVLVRGQVQVETAWSCSRCLASVTDTASLEIEEEYFPVIDVITGRRVPMPEDADPTFSIDANHTLDLTEVLRQCLITEAPMKPLCRPECQGLCRTCGVNLNQAACSCGGASDPRWGALADLLRNQN